MMGGGLAGPRRAVVALACCLTVGASALLLTGAAGAATPPAPVVMTDVCVNPSRGQMSFPIGGTCPAGHALVAVDDPSATFQTCYLNSNGAIRKLPVGAQCVSAPRSKKETLLIVPSLASDLYLCAGTTDGTLFFRGTSPVSCKSGQFLVVIEQANNAPVATAATVTTLEDTVGATTLSATDEDGDALTFAIVGQGTKGTAALTGSTSCDALTPSTCTRGVSYTPQPDANGSDSFTFSASDLFASGAAAVAVTITPVNDAPSFTKGGNQNVNEDAGAQSVAGWATAISAGPANEVGQAVSFSVTGNSNPSLFSTAPAVSPTGELTYTPAADAFGTATIQVAISDDGGTANGGVDTSAAQSFTITVDAVNDAPSFTKGAGDTVAEDSGPRSVASWATAISAGPGEGGQSVSFQVSNDNPGLFSSQPAVSPGGTLTYTPAADAFGTATVSVVAQDDGGTANGGDDTSDAQTFSITVTAVNDAPSFDIPGGDPAAIDEDATPQVVSGFATSISAGANESGQGLTFLIVDISNVSLFNGIAGLPTIDPVTGDLTYAAAPNANGAAIVEVRLQDDGGTANGGVDTSASRFFTITVNAVNDAPTFSHGGNQTVNEDAGAQSAAGFATGSAGPPNESGQTLSYTVSNDSNGLFSAQPAIAPDGTLTYTPAANAYGSATVTVFVSDNGGNANGGVDTSAAQQFTITVNAVNDEPSFSLPASPNQSVAQDSGAQTVSGFATSISAGPNEGGQTVTFDVSNGNNALFSAQPDIDETSGDLTYTPAGGATGSATVSVFLSDDGGTANGGDDTSPTQQFTISVNLPNEAPVANGQSVDASEDGAAVPITLTASDADDDNLSFSIVASPTKGSLGSLGAADCSAATTCSAVVNYTPAADENGADSFTFKVNDGTVDSNTATVAITIAAVNDAPSFTKGADDTVLEDSGARTVSGWATAISAGPANESGETVSFTVTNNTNAALFAVAPSVNSSGDLSYTPAANAFGSATITLKAVDDGTPPAESPTQSFLITVTPVNDVPSDIALSNASVNENEASGTSVGTLSATDQDVGDTHTFTLVAGAGDTDNASFQITGTSLTTSAVFNYEVKDSYSIRIRVTDSGSATREEQFTISIVDVNDAPVAAADSYGNAVGNTRAVLGTSGSGPHIVLTGDVVTNNDTDEDTTFPNAISAVAETVASTGGGSATIASDGSFTFLPGVGDKNQVDTFTYHITDGALQSAGTVSVTIANVLVWYVDDSAGAGDGRSNAPFNSLASLNGAGGAGDSDTTADIIFLYSGTYGGGLPLEASQKLTGEPHGLVVNPGSGNVVLVAAGGANPTIGNAGGAGVGLATNVEVQRVNVNGTAGAGVTGSAITNATIGANTSIGGTTGNAFELSGAASGTIDVGSTISAATARSISVQNRSGGSVNLTGNVTDTGQGILLSSNTGATINLTGSLTLSTGTNPGFTATGGGTVNASTASNTIATTTGTALNVADTAIGSSGLTFRSIASNGAVNGIVLSNTGSTAGLTVTGTGSAGTGGVIQNSTGPGILLTSTRAPSFSWMTIQNGGDDGIRGSGVNGFTLASSTVFNNGNAVNESGLDFVGGLTGTASISSSTVNTYAENGVIVTNASGSLNLTVTGSSFVNASATTGNDGIHLDANDTAAITASITGSTFDNNRGDHFQFSTNAASSGTNSVTFSSNTLTGDRGAPFGNDLGAGITISTTGSSDTAFTVASNNIQGAVFPTIGIDLGTASTAGATLSGTIDGNTIGNAAVAASGGAQSSAIAVVGQGAGTLTAAVTNNTIRQNDGFAGIDILSRDGSPTINATVTGNSIANPAAGGGNGLLLRNGAITTDGGFTCAAITGNSLAGSAVAGLDDFRLRQRFNTTVRLPGYAGAAGDTAAVVAFVQGNNPGAETGSATVDFPATGGGFVGGAACPTP